MFGNIVRRTILYQIAHFFTRLHFSTDLSISYSYRDICDLCITDSKNTKTRSIRGTGRGLNTLKPSPIHSSQKIILKTPQFDQKFVVIAHLSKKMKFCLKLLTASPGRRIAKGVVRISKSYLFSNGISNGIGLMLNTTWWEGFCKSFH